MPARLRAALADESKADQNAPEALDAVRKGLINAGVYQVAVDTDAVACSAGLAAKGGRKNAGQINGKNRKGSFSSGESAL